jgi:hypothetical protein
MIEVNASAVYERRRRQVEQLRGTAQSTEPADCTAPWEASNVAAVYAARRDAMRTPENPGSS